MTTPKQTDHLQSTFDLGLSPEGRGEVVPVLDRLQICYLQEGFLPTSRAELNEAYNLRTFIHSRGGAAKHLAEVASRQRNHGVDDPQRAGIHLTRQYASYAMQARTGLTMLSTLKEELNDLPDTNRLAGLPKESIHTGLGQFVRFLDLRKLADTKSFDTFSFPPLRRYSVDMPETHDPYTARHPAKHIADRIDEVVTKTRVWEAQREVVAAMTDQKARQLFWANRLEEIGNHQTGSIRVVARQVLKTLGITSEVHV